MTLRELSNTTLINEPTSEVNAQATPRMRMSEKEFVKWCGTEGSVQAEWADGQVIMMAPVSGGHSDLNFWLMRVFAAFVEARDLGLLRGPQFQIRLASQRARREPDIMFVSNARLKLAKPNHLEGAPDLIVEIVSPESESRDRRDKFLEYESAGVREYWIVDPLSKTVELYVLGRDRSYKLVAERDGKLNSRVLKGLYIRPKWLWQSPLPKIAKITKELRIR